ncbi:sugar ABC transporter substrate-binding protein [Rhizobium rhizogenes]|uniref:Sugar ABC transporter n=1 Tax=Rhizobium rhizogenes (strain K84 / ATCC BAA-868) TaxID=311403 RepID=B9JIV0_RHIR8|nr:MULTISPECIES: sugar ABC transporter substrate-binding protein [Rhizobium]ACM29842.1 sugar ABC transporter [Rhizobium rhizogenes K84]EJK84195.1 ABC-type sugar transport system, periplasmic component [Rhizobium sp. AP16]MDJ1635331.1 sugar ABC transporter substrate-binding protein [Rhizobium rhizogenes]NTF84347.1 sugar ABC transporter substrate-binding protein [Rhizobium rhizogenes]NTG10758.1 sugar ABC transporter substrate-binding protein [Rhizobium rhizogenes]
MQILSSGMRVSIGLVVSALALGAMTGSAVAQAKETITFAAAMFSEAGRGDRAKAWVDKFNKSQDKIEVQPIAIPFSSFANTVFTQMGGGGGPDIIRFDQIDYFAAVPSGKILPLDDVIKDGDYKFTAPDKYLKVDGKRYGVIFDTTGYAMLYNKDLLKAGVPTTFDAFLDAAKKMTGNGQFGYAYRATMAERAGFWQDLCNYVFGFGGRWSKDGKLTVNSPEVVAGVTAYKKAYDLDITPKGADAATYRRMFWEGKVAMEIDNGGVAAIFHQNSPNLAFAAAPSPFPTPAQGLIMTMLSINANTKHKDATVAFLKWALEPENQKELSTAMGTLIGTVVDRTPEENAAQPWLAVYDKQVENAVPQLVMGMETKTPEIQQIVLENVLKVLQGGTDPQEAMDAAQKLIERRVLRR